MTSWLERQTSSHRVQLAAAAIASGVVVAGAIYGAQAIRREENLERLKASIPDEDESHPANLVSSTRYSHILRIWHDLLWIALTESVKLTDLGIPSKLPASTREEDRAAALARRAQHGDYDKGEFRISLFRSGFSTKSYILDLVTEQLTRTASFLGEDGFRSLRDSFVLVVGMGGVGSHCASSLARSGVSKLRLIDFDQVTLSSLNRHAVATLADVGTPKVDCVRKRLQAVVPWLHWECFNEIWKEDQAKRLMAAWDNGRGRKPDYVVDAIDNIDSKVALLRYCHMQGLKVVSSMGAGCKSDPSRIFVGDISASTEDPLSRSTRRRLRAAGISTGIPVVYSTEKPGQGKAELLPLPEEEFNKGSVNELSVLPDFRARILPVLGTMPAIFGQTVANFVIMEITGYPHEISEGKARDKLYDNMLATLQGSEERLYRRLHYKNAADAAAAGALAQGLKISVTKDDVGYLVDEIYRGKSVISGVPTRLALVRWRKPPSDYSQDVGRAAGADLPPLDGQKSVRLSLNELVCMTREEALAHEREVLTADKKVEDVYDQSVLDLVRSRMEEERHFQRFR